MNPVLAPLTLIVGFIPHMCKAGVPYYELNTTKSAISKGYITDKNMELTFGKHPLVARAKKAF